MEFGFEKENLSAHVEICYSRFTQLQEELEGLNKNISKLDENVAKLDKKVMDMHEARNTQLLNWATAIIATLITGLAYVVKLLVFK